VATPRIIDVEEFLVWSKREAVRQCEIVDQQSHGAKVGGQTIKRRQKSGPIAAVKPGWSTDR
jgi:hypothetical protein